MLRNWKAKPEFGSNYLQYVSEKGVVSKLCEYKELLDFNTYKKKTNTSLKKDKRFKKLFHT